MTPQEQVKMLRYAAARFLTAAQNGDYDYTDAECGMREVLAATAPPKPYTVDGRDIRVTRTASSWRHVCTFYVDATPEERAAVLDALNALAEKEQAR